MVPHKLSMIFTLVQFLSIYRVWVFRWIHRNDSSTFHGFNIWDTLFQPGRKPDPSHAKGFRNDPVPTKIATIRSLLRLASCYSRLVPMHTYDHRGTKSSDEKGRSIYKELFCGRERSISLCMGLQEVVPVHKGTPIHTADWSSIVDYTTLIKRVRTSDDAHNTLGYTFHAIQLHRRVWSWCAELCCCRIIATTVTYRRRDSGWSIRSLQGIAFQKWNCNEQPQMIRFCRNDLSCGEWMAIPKAAWWVK